MPRTYQNSEPATQPRKRGRALRCAALLTCVSSHALGAPADLPAPPPPSASTKANVVEQAREAFRQGAELAKAGRWREAVASFEKSHGLKPHPVTSYNIGFCERALEHYTRARKMFARALEEHRAGTEGPLPDDLIPLAQHYLEEVDGRIARLEILVDAPARVRLLVDDLPVEKDSVVADATPPVLVANTSPEGASQVVPAARFLVLLDPGRHTFAFSYPGGAAALVAQSFAPGSRSFLQQISPQPAEKPLPAAAVSSPTKARKTWAYVALGVGAVGVAAGSLAGIVALGKKSSLDANCGPNHQACSSRDDIDSMKAFADASTVGFVLGAVGVGVGLGLYLSAPEPHSARVALELSPNHFGVAGEF